jgi:MFS family permease
MDWYAWIVFVHVAAAFLFVMGHGAAMWVSDQIRYEWDATRIKVLLVMSSRSLGLYAALVTLVVAGIIAGIMHGHFSRGWIWAAIAVLVAIIVLMYAWRSLITLASGRQSGSARVAIRRTRRIQRPCRPTSWPRLSIRDARTTSGLSA